VASPSVAPSSTELRLVAQGFGQAGDSVGFAFVVKNTSPSLVTGPTGYVVTAYNAAGAVVRTGGGTIGVVLPGQQQGVAGALAVPSTSPVARIDVKLEPPAFHFPWTADPRALATTAVALRRDSSLATASGIVTNSGAIGFDGAIVSAIAYNATGQIVGGGATTTGPIPPNGRVSVDVPITTSIPPIQLELYAAPRALPAIH
jgi:hypothetical protein